MLYQVHETTRTGDELENNNIFFMFYDTIEYFDMSVNNDCISI
jgi:hypothetical protein